MAAITLDSVQKIFDGRHVAVRELSLDIADGELMVLVGPSGSGKSTVLRLIAGLDLPTSGRILINRQDVTDLAPQQRDLAMVFQSYALYPHLTVQENLSFGLRMRRTAPAEISTRVADVAALLSIEDLLHRRPSQLSGGQRQRVALGRAIVRQPQAFLFDEPLSNLDPSLRLDTRAQLAVLHRRLNATMVYVTHDQEEAMTLGTRIGVMRDGALEQVDRPSVVYGRPVNTFVAQFVGSPAMNLIAPGVSPQLDRLSALGAAGPMVTFGVRPHDIVLTSADDPEADAKGKVETIEPLGSTTIVHVALSDRRGVSLRVVVPADSEVAPDDVVAMRFRRDRLHAFDSETGRRLEDRTS
jgi:multiple sugar transport system ATP-binding protein